MSPMETQTPVPQLERFTVRDVRRGKEGVTDGRAWATYLIFTSEGEMLSSFDSDWLLMVGCEVEVEVLERVYNGKTYRSVRKPPKQVPERTMPIPSPTSAPVPPGGSAQTTLADARDAATLARLDTGVEQLLRKVDGIAAKLGDVAEWMRTLSTHATQRSPRNPEHETDPQDEFDETGTFDPEDPGPEEPSQGIPQRGARNTRAR
jgi:hypothetical protein